MRYMLIMRSTPEAEKAMAEQNIDFNEITSSPLFLVGAAFGLIGLLHVYILVLEMFLWDKPAGLRAFGQTQAAATATKVLAANQGLYNGFLAAGLIWGLLAADPIGFQVKVFFLLCVIVAGLYGAATVSRRILLVQALPAVVALVAVGIVGSSAT